MATRMSKKHYEAVATAISEQAGKYDLDNSDNRFEVVWEIASSLAGVFGQQDPKFDRAKFLEACGVE